MGGGNHFIEVERSADGALYLVIHSGSRNLGKQVAEYYQNLAVRLDEGYDEYFSRRETLIAEYKAAGRRKEIQHKGAIAAHKGEKVLIPINMRDGSVLAAGRGNPEWNFSAPHGAGRLMSRSAAREALNMADYEAAMRGVYTTCVNVSTLDEAPMAYKSLADIVDIIRGCVDVIDIMKPIYNFKASG